MIGHGIELSRPYADLNLRIFRNLSHVQKIGRRLILGTSDSITMQSIQLQDRKIIGIKVTQDTAIHFKLRCRKTMERCLLSEKNPSCA